MSTERRTAIVGALVVLASACSQAPPASVATPTASSPPPVASAVPSQSPTPAATTLQQPTGSYAVIESGFFDSPRYTVSLVDTAGHIAATATARTRSTFAQISNLSVSETTLYYLDGDSDVRSLRPDGTTGVVTRIPATPKRVATFAVSPDDRRIAVSILDYTHYPVGTRLYVEDLHGGGNHIELFSSSNVLEWPVGWHKGHIVMALGINEPPQNAGDFFDRGFGYQVVDAQTGRRLLSVCVGFNSLYLETAAGMLCVAYTNATPGVDVSSVISWDGSSRLVPHAGGCALDGPPSPTGVIATVVTGTTEQGCAADESDSIFLVDSDGKYDRHVVAKGAVPVAWTDANHLVVDAGPFRNTGIDLSIVAVKTQVVAHIAGDGFFAAALPGGL
jgi:hypothetical protein